MPAPGANRSRSLSPGGRDDEEETRRQHIRGNQVKIFSLRDIIFTKYSKKAKIVEVGDEEEVTYTRPDKELLASLASLSDVPLNPADFEVSSFR